MRIVLALLCLLAAVSGRAGGVKTGRTITSPVSPAAALLVQGAFKASGRAPSGLLSSLGSLDLSAPGAGASLAPFLNALVSRVEAFPEDVPGVWFTLPDGFPELSASEQSDLLASALADLPAGRRDAVIEGTLKEAAREAEKAALKYIEAAEDFLYGKNAARRRLLGPMRLYVHNLKRLESSLSLYLSQPTLRRLTEARVVTQKVYLRTAQAELAEKLEARAKSLEDATLALALSAEEGDGGKTAALTPEALAELRRFEAETTLPKTGASTSLILIKSLARHGLNGDAAVRKLTLENIERLSMKAEAKVRAEAARELKKAWDLAAGDDLKVSAERIDGRPIRWRKAVRILAPVESFLRKHSRWAIYAFGLGAVTLSRDASPGLFWQAVFVAAAVLALAALWKAVRRA